MVADLTGFALSNASLLDESTAAAEAMSMCYNLQNQKRKRFVVDADCHPQNIAVVQTRAAAWGIEVEVADVRKVDWSTNQYIGALCQYPSTRGQLNDWSSVIADAHKHSTMMVAATDLLASVLATPAGELGFDIAVGTSQRFGVPMGFGGPHAGFLATTEA
jgi:glycine dehydrogenase